MKLNDLYNEVSKKADTAKKPIDAGTTRHVLTVAFKLLGQLPAAECHETLAKAMASAAKAKPVK